MPQINPGTSTITTFGFSATMDIYGRSLAFNLLPFTTGPNLANRPVAFSVEDEDGVVLASINWSTPQIANAGTTTSWVLDLSSVNFPFLFQTYRIYAAIQDTDGTVYSTNIIYPNICQPNDLTDSGYVPGLFQIIPDCINSVLTVKEITAQVYNSLQPSSVSKTGNLYYPTGTIAAVPFSNTPFSNNTIYTGQYRIQCTTVAKYAIGNDVYVLVSYITNNVFQVTCANKMADIVCCITKLQQTAIKNCNNAIGENARQQLSDISLYVMNGLLKETSGQDAQFEVDYIRKFLSCDCGSSSLTQSEFTPINPAVTSIVLNGIGGTSIPSPTPTGNTLTYNIASSIYQIVKGNTGDLAFTIQIDTSVDNTVKYIITFNYDTMAGYILTAISNNPTLIAQLNALITATGGSLQGLNGSCIIDLTKTNYSLSQAITGATLVTNIVINGNNFAAPYNLFANNPSAVAAWLNGLTLGVFSASVVSGILTILSVNNTNTVSTLSFTSPNVVQQFQATNATLVQVLQAIINYLCGITDLQIALNNNLALCTLDYNNVVVTTNYPATSTKQRDYNVAVANAICNICSRISSLTALTCSKIQSIFQDNPNGVFGTSDRMYGTLGGNCASLTDRQTALMFLAAVNKYSDVKSAWCAIDCSVPGSCPDISAINASVVSGNIGVYGVSFTSTPSANQLVTVRYRVTGSMTWLVATNALNLFPNGNINGTSPFIIPGGTPGTTYDLWISNNCGGNGFVTQVTTPTGTVYTGQFLLGNVIYALCGVSPTTLYSNAPFATGVTMYLDAGLTSIASGHLLIASVLTGQIFNMNNSTAVVGSNTGSTCTTGTAGVYKLSNSSGSVCAASPVTLYTNGAFAVGQILYIDPSLTTPQTGFSFVGLVSTNHIYNLNSSTGAVGSDTGLLCTGAAILTFHFVNAGGSFLNCQANLNISIDANVNINRFFADGFTSSVCSGGAVSSAQKNTTMTITAGSTATGSVPDSTTGTWASAIKDKVYNIIVNGSAMVDGSVLMIGSYNVTMSIPSCE